MAPVTHYALYQLLVQLFGGVQMRHPAPLESLLQGAPPASEAGVSEALPKHLVVLGTAAIPARITSGKKS